MDLELECPHCKIPFVVKENDINCGIFRHAVHKKDYSPVNPHETKINCDKLVQDGLVYGCAKPFQIIKEGGKYVVKVCDYI